ncbi:MAG: NAD(P)-binding domain-containing protein [Aggregatilineales bacterium]
MKIGIIGTGRIGSTLGNSWADAGHEVMFGARDPQNVKLDLSALIGTFNDAVDFAEVVVFAIPGSVMIDTAKSFDLGGKLVIDCTNGGGSPEKTGVQQLAENHPSARVFKAFNTLGFENFAQPNFDGTPADMLFIGDEAKKQVAAQLISDAGLRPVYVGDLSNHDILDLKMRLWFRLSQRFGRHTAFSILTDTTDLI